MGANATTSVPTYVAGQVLEAADLNITNSGVPVFADSTARDAAFGGSGEKTLAEGQLAYLEDSNIVQYYDSSSWQTLGPSTAIVSSTATVATSQTTSSTSYTDLATTGPSVTLTTGTTVLVLVSAFMDNNNATIYTDFAISGATTRSASDTTCLLDLFAAAGTKRMRATVANLVTVTAGSNTFTMKYRVAGGTGAWQDRTIGVISL